MSRTVAVPSKSQTTARSVTARLVSGHPPWRKRSLADARPAALAPEQARRDTLRAVNLTDTELFQEAARRSAEREAFVLCTVTATARSVPRDAGAKMIVAPDGTIAGTVGGGPLEAVVI